MFETILSLAIGVGATIAVLAIAFVVGMRRKSRLLFAPLIGLQRTVMNPIQLRRAGQPGAYAGIIRHHGRRTGNAYETPVGILADGGGFLVALPYGSGTQWLRNVLAAGGAELVTEGRTVSVVRPEIIATSSVADRFSATDRRMFRWFATTDCLRLRRADEVEETHDAAPIDAAAA